MTLDEPNAVVMGKEPVYHGGKVVGYVTSANYGYSVGKFIAYGYLPTEIASPGTKVEIEYFGKGVGATVATEPLWDARSERLRG